MKVEELEKGKIYFQVGFVDNAQTQPVLISYEFLEIDNDPKTPYIFRYHADYRPVDEEAPLLAYTKEQAENLETIEKTIELLKETRDRHVFTEAK